MSSATVYKVSGEVTELDHRPTLKEAQEIVGGWIELVKVLDTEGKAATLVVDGEGKLKNYSSNYRINREYGTSVYNGYIVGNAIVLRGWQTVGGS